MSSHESLLTIQVKCSAGLSVRHYLNDMNVAIFIIPRKVAIFYWRSFRMFSKSLTSLKAAIISAIVQFCSCCQSHADFVLQQNEHKDDKGKSN